uniref:Beta-defensin-like domain-containing protein n=1 Tax=Gopherus evgoodei TaxID=1825980 RepID=A0A8C4Y0X9_9SAUR
MFAFLICKCVFCWKGILPLFAVTCILGSAYDTLQCLSKHGHCRRLCFHMERQVGTCTNGHMRCCK